MKQNNFFIIGNGGGGTSLLRGMLNAHSRIDCKFEYKPGGNPDQNIQLWTEESGALENGTLWGNKIPFEQFLSMGFTRDQKLSLINKFKIIWLIRRYSMYHQNRKGPYEENWHHAQEIYWAMRELHPDRIIMVSFEDLLLRTPVELMRICDFLNLEYEPEMMKGTLDTGLKRYNQGKINRARV